jgi:outer membrane immunogenic protein
MKKLVIVASALVLGSASASAADLAYKAAPPPMAMAIYNWSGFYVGGNAGWGNSHDCWTRTATLGAVTHVSEGCHDASGGTIGGQVGYRWQAGPWLFGLEAQGNWADFSGSNISLVSAATTNRTRMDAFGLFTGQVGYAWGNVLGYVKGGAAITGNRYEGLSTASGAVVDRVTDSRWGATVGAGIEYGFAPNWSAALEYDHLFMGTNNYGMTNVATLANTRNVDVKQDVDLVTVRVNYRFGGPIVARY